MQDGARAHASSLVHTFLKEKGISVIQDWPPRSPDLNPIENLWAILARKVSDCGPTDEADLKTYIKKVWDDYPQTEIDKLVLSFKRRAAQCIKSSGRKVK